MQNRELVSILFWNSFFFVLGQKKNWFCLKKKEKKNVSAMKCYKEKIPLFPVDARKKL